VAVTFGGGMLRDLCRIQGSPAEDAGLRQRMKAIAQERRRFFRLQSIGMASQ